MNLTNVFLVLFGLALMVPAAWGAEDNGPWPATVPGFVPPKAGEHPRLLFRKGDLPKLKERAQTPEGKAIIARLCYLLDTKNGDTFPTQFNTNPPVDTGPKGLDQLPLGTFTLGHGAGYGLLYQLTGEKKYADLSRQALEKMFAGASDRDERYTWTRPGSGLRTGKLMTCVALAYDLAYDGWDEAFRRKVVDEIQNYRHVCVNDKAWSGGKEGIDLQHIALPYYPPTSNHYGALIGGAATAILAIQGDPGADDDRLMKLRAEVEKNIIRNLTEGFGDHGMFAEGPGPSHMAANTSFTTALQTMRVAGGKDFVTPRPNGQWLTLRWAFETVIGKDGQPYYPCRNPTSYGTESFARKGEFAQGFGAIPDAMKPALLWTYRNCVEPGEIGETHNGLRKDEKSYDAVQYPDHGVLAFVNFPIGTEPSDPGKLLGHSYHDTIHGYLAFRNRWKDADDCIVTAYLKSGPHGFIKNNDVAIKVWGLGIRTTLPGVTGKLSNLDVKPDGSGTFNVENGTTVAVDFSGISGAPCVVALAGASIKAKAGVNKSQDGSASARTTVLTIGGQSVVVLTLQQADAPEVRDVNGTLVVGKQTYRLEGGTFTIGK